MHSYLLTISTILALTIVASPFPLGQTAQSPSKTFTLDRVVTMFLERSLELEAARYRVDRARAEQIAARLRPNPGLTVTAENLKFNGPLPFSRLYETGFSYSETIELGGKRRLRQEVADLGLSVAEAELADTLRQRVSEVKRLYYEALLARSNMQIATENRELFDQLVSFNLARYEEGAIPEGDLIKVKLERMKFDSALKQAELTLTQAAIRLQERLGDLDFDRVEITGDLEFTQISLSLATLKEAALSTRPDVRAAGLGVQLTEQRVALETAKSSPDISPFVGYRRVGSDNTLLVGVSLPLRVRDRNEAGIARAVADGKIAQTQVGLVRNRVLADVEAAFRAYESARNQVNVLQTELLPQAEESRDITLAAYEEGATELLPVLEAQRTRAEVRQQLFRSIFEYQLGLLQLELAVGREIRP